MGLNVDFYFVKHKLLMDFRKYYFLASYFENLHINEDINSEFIEINDQTALDLYCACRRVLCNPKLASKYFPGSENFSADDYDETFLDKVQQVANFIKDKLFPIYKHVDEDNKVMVNVNY